MSNHLNIENSIEELNHTRNSIPSIELKNVDKHELKKEFSKSSLELDQYIIDGPVFGWPIICFSPPSKISKNPK